jgi:hypothetical protein
MDSVFVSLSLEESGDCVSVEIGPKDRNNWKFENGGNLVLNKVDKENARRFIEIGNILDCYGKNF